MVRLPARASTCFGLGPYLRLNVSRIVSSSWQTAAEHAGEQYRLGSLEGHLPPLEVVDDAGGFDHGDRQSTSR